ncbi:hypothetical protein [Pseudaeromonas pectinilytica]
MTGSPDIYQYNHSDPEKSINFVTCHDGFTLWDLVSYNQKNNHANGEENRDGMSDNYSWNHGIEGETDNQEIDKLRVRQCKNLLTAIMLSIGTPMLLMGDEHLRTQHGNNNAYCQNTPLSWMNWRKNERSDEMQRYTQELIKYRKYLFSRAQHEGMMVSLAEILHRSEICWHGVNPYSPDWDANSHSLAMTAISLDVKVAIYIIFNAYWAPLQFNLPLPPQNINGNWHRIGRCSLYVLGQSILAVSSLD